MALKLHKHFQPIIVFCMLLCMLFCGCGAASFPQGNESTVSVKAAMQEHFPMLYPVRESEASEQIFAHPASARIQNLEEVIGQLRAGLKNRASAINIQFSYPEEILEELADVVEDWMEAALRETGDPAEGDYIRLQYGGYEYSCSYEKAQNAYTYRVRIVPRYYGYAADEEKVDQKIRELRSVLPIAESDLQTSLEESKSAGNGSENFSERTAAGPESGSSKEQKNSTDADRIRAIYDYLCTSVTYDKVHRKNPYVHRKSTAYAALVLKTATCPGYCTALYRLLMEAGIPARIVTGAAGEDSYHAWVICFVDGAWYAMDPTWDAGHEEYQYFLKGAESFFDHVPAARYTAEEFRQLYPLSASDYSE